MKRGRVERRLCLGRVGPAPRAVTLTMRLDVAGGGTGPAVAGFGPGGQHLGRRGGELTRSIHGHGSRRGRRRSPRVVLGGRHGGGGGRGSPGMGSAPSGVPGPWGDGERGGGIGRGGGAGAVVVGRGYRRRGRRWWSGGSWARSRGLVRRRARRRAPLHSIRALEHRPSLVGRAGPVCSPRPDMT